MLLPLCGYLHEIPYSRHCDFFLVVVIYPSRLNLSKRREWGGSECKHLPVSLKTLEIQNIGHAQQYTRLQFQKYLLARLFRRPNQSLSV